MIMDIKSVLAFPELYSSFVIENITSLINDSELNTFFQLCLLYRIFYWCIIKSDGFGKSMEGEGMRRI